MELPDQFLLSRGDVSGAHRVPHAIALLHPQQQQQWSVHPQPTLSSNRPFLAPMMQLASAGAAPAPAPGGLVGAAVLPKVFARAQRPALRPVPDGLQGIPGGVLQHPVSAALKRSSTSPPSPTPPAARPDDAGDDGPCDCNKENAPSTSTSWGAAGTFGTIMAANKRLQELRLSEASSGAALGLVEVRFPQVGSAGGPRSAAAAAAAAADPARPASRQASRFLLDHRGAGGKDTAAADAGCRDAGKGPSAAGAQQRLAWTTATAPPSAARHQHSRGPDASSDADVGAPADDDAWSPSATDPDSDAASGSSAMDLDVSEDAFCAHQPSKRAPAAAQAAARAAARGAGATAAGGARGSSKKAAAPPSLAASSLQQGEAALQVLGSAINGLSNAVLLELPGEFDVSGDMGSIGRVEGPVAECCGQAAPAAAQPCSRQEAKLDLKGVVYTPRHLQLAGSCAVVRLGKQGAAGSTAHMERCFQSYLKLTAAADGDAAQQGAAAAQGGAESSDSQAAGAQLAAGHRSSRPAPRVSSSKKRGASTGAKRSGRADSKRLKGS